MNQNNFTFFETIIDIYLVSVNFDKKQVMTIEKNKNEHAKKL